MLALALTALLNLGLDAAVTAHRPVMLEESLAGLSVSENGVYVDATFGRGGHSEAILDRLGAGGALHAFDQDPEACAHARHAFAGRAHFYIHPRNFSALREVCEQESIFGKLRGILFDLGVSSPQFDDAARGFSFSQDGPLDMRMNPREGESAAQWLARAKAPEIAEVLWQYGEERASRRLAQAIVAAREQAPIATTARLAQILLEAHRGPRQKIHPATRSFQAIRIHVNRELAVLESALVQALAALAPGGRLAVISFHSLEDRIVKRFIRAAESAGTLKKISREFPSDSEIAGNARARSAVLRVAQKA